MKEKINLIELLKDCPHDMELNCISCDNVFFDKIDYDAMYPIKCYTLLDDNRDSINLTEFGTISFHTNSKCVIFPKGKTTWEGFQRPFKDGDVSY